MSRVMRKIKFQGGRKNASRVDVASFSMKGSRIEMVWPWLLMIFFGLSPLVVVSGYTPDGRLFCTLYDLPKFHFIMAFVPLLTAVYCFNLYQDSFQLDSCIVFVRYNYGVKIFLLLLLISTISIFHSLVVKSGIYNLVNYILLGVLWFILAQKFQQNRLRWVAVSAMFAAMFTFAGLGILQFFGYEIPFLLPILGPASTFGYRNPAAHFIALILPFVVFAASHYWQKWCHTNRPPQLVFFIILMLLLAVALALLFMNYSRVAIMALLAECMIVPLFWFLSRKRDAGGKVRGLRRLVTVTSLLLIVVVSLIIVFPNSRKRVENSIKNFQQGGIVRLLEFRYYHWGNSLMMIKDHSLLGVGLGNWRFNYPLYYKSFAQDPLFNYQTQVRKAHNDYLQLAAECGIPALMLFLLLWGRQFYLLRYSTVADDDGEDWRLPILASLTAFSVIMFFSFPMQMAYSRMFCFFLLALGEARAWPALLK